MLKSLAFLIRRTGRYWQVLTMLCLGVFLATAMLSSGPALVNTAIEFGLRHTLIHAAPLESNLRFTVSIPPDASAYEALNAQMQTLLARRLGHTLNQIIPTGSTRWAYPWIDGQPTTNQRINLRFYDDDLGVLFQHINRIGELDTDKIRPEPNVVSALIGETMAQAYTLSVGDRLALCLREQAEQPDLWIQVAGIIRPKNFQETYWFGNLSPFYVQKTATYVAQYGALVPQDAFLDIAAELLAPSDVDTSWHVQLDPDAITTDDLPRIQAVIPALLADAQALNSRIRLETELDQTLQTFGSHAQAARTPLYFLTATVVLLALYYVTMDATLSLRQFEREFAVLRSRGASGWQLFRIQLLEAGLICLAALIGGPGLSLLFVRALAAFGPLTDISQTQWAIRLPQASWLAALVGSIACLISLLTPVPAALKRSIVDYQQGRTRAERPPWWQRYYLDVFVMVAGLVLIWRLRLYGSLGGNAAQVDWLLLLSPLALLLGSTTILLRVFPLLLSLGAQIAGRARGLPLTLALWQAARDPTHIARLVLLLTLAMALGLFSTGLNAALDRNEIDQSYYTAGSDLRIINPSVNLERALDGLPGIERTSKTWRDQATIAVQTIGAYPYFDLLAVDANELTLMIRYRTDFADQPIPTLLARLNSEQQFRPTLPLPGQPESIGLWLWAPNNIYKLYSIRVEAKLANQDGELYTMNLKCVGDATGNIDEWQWYYFEGKLSGNQVYPLSLYSIWLRNHESELNLRDLSVIDRQTGILTIIDDMSAPGQIWELCPGSSKTLYGACPRGSAQTRPVPALIDKTFQTVAQLEVGDRVGTWVDSRPTEFEIVGIVDYFPTLYANLDGGFLIADRDALLAHLNNSEASVVRPNELWIEAEADVSAETLEKLPGLIDGNASLTDMQILEAETVRKNIAADPMSLGLRSVTLFGYILTTVLSLAGFGTHFYMSTRQRGSMYAVLRALGFSPPQLYGMLLFEQILLILSGLGLGTVLGLLLNRLTLPGLPLSLGGRPPVPPFLAQTDWAAVGRIYLTLAVIFMLLLGLATALLWRIKLHQILRVDEE